MGDTFRPDCSDGDSTQIGTWTMDDADGPKRVEGKVDITTPNKPNKTPILISYKLNVRLFIKTNNVERKTSRSTTPK